MHEKDAITMIKPVFDNFAEQNFKDASDIERDMSLLCIKDFIADSEPYWVMQKSRSVIFHILHFAEEMAARSANIKDAVLLLLDAVEKELAELVEDDIDQTDGTISIEVTPPHWIRLDSWKQISWNRPKESV